MSRDLFGAVHEATSLVTAGYRDEEQERVTHLIREQASFVEDVLGGAWRSSAEMIERGRELGFPLTTRCLLIIVLPRTERDTPRLKDAMARFARHLGDSAISGPIRHGSVGHGVVLVPLPDELAELSTVVEGVDTAAIDACVVALAQVIVDLGGMAAGYESLRDDAGLARAASRSPRLLMVDDLHEYRVLREASPGDAFTFIRSVLGSLLALAPNAAAQLIETLEVVVSSDASIEALAAQMHISYSGLRYRIRRITEITGTAPNDRTVRFRMQLALRLFRVHERRLPALGDSQWEPGYVPR
jgi:sugar diacid utilization regulator